MSAPTSQGLLIGLVGVPRFAERALEIEGRTASHRRRLVEARRELEAAYGEGDLLAAALRRLARSWCFDDVNALIDEHNRWFPIERNLPLVRRVAGTLGSNGKRIFAQFLMRNQSQIAAVDTAAESHYARAHLPQDLPQPVFLFLHARIVTDS